MTVQRTRPPLHTFISLSVITTLTLFGFVVFLSNGDPITSRYPLGLSLLSGQHTAIVLGFLLMYWLYTYHDQLSILMLIPTVVIFFSTHEALFNSITFAYYGIPLRVYLSPTYIFTMMVIVICTVLIIMTVVMYPNYILRKSWKQALPATIALASLTAYWLIIGLPLSANIFDLHKAFEYSNFVNGLELLWSGIFIILFYQIFNLKKLQDAFRNLFTVRTQIENAPQ